MKKSSLFIFIILFVVGVLIWFILCFNAKVKYDRARQSLLAGQPEPYKVVQMTPEMSSLLDEIKKDWVKQYSETDGPYADTLRLVGLEPTVENLIYLLNYEMPDYSFFYLWRNKKALIMGQGKALLLPISIDAAIHVTENESTAMIRATKTAVQIFSDTVGGLKESMYYVAGENSKQEGTIKHNQNGQ